MAEDTEMQLIENVKKSKWFALQLDETTYIQNNNILVSYVRYTDYSVGNMTEDTDIYFASLFCSQTTSAEIFKAIGDLTEKSVGVKKLRRTLLYRWCRLYDWQAFGSSCQHKASSRR
jgi:hypothetical protein